MKRWLVLGLMLLAGTGSASAARLDSVNMGEDATKKGTLRYEVGAPQVVSLSEVSAQTAAVTYGLVRILCDVDCFYLPGDNPTATTSSHFLPASAPYDIVVPVGQKIAFVLASGAGNAYVTEFH